MISVNTVVVGAGLAGLATSAALADHGVDHVVLERDRVGESWRSARWDSFRLNSVRSMSGMSGDGFAPAAEFVASLERRAERLPVLEGVDVRRVWRTRTGRYVISSSEGVVDARHVIAASGAQRVPRLPAVASTVTGRDVQHLHTADYRNPQDLPEGAVLVVGSGQSGVQIADDLLNGGRRVFLATSKVPRAPRRYRGRDTLVWLHEAGWYEATDRPARPERPPQIGAGRSISLQSLSRAGCVLLGRVLGAEGARLALGDELGEHVRYADAASQRIRGVIDAHIAANGISAPDAHDDPADAPLGPLSWPRHLDLRAEGISTVIWATGFTGDYGWLTMPILRPDGLPYQRGGVTASDGLYTVGVPWQTRRRSAILSGLEDDARTVASRVAERSERRFARHAFR